LRPPTSTLFPYTTLFRSRGSGSTVVSASVGRDGHDDGRPLTYRVSTGCPLAIETRLNALMRVVVHSTAEIWAVVRWDAARALTASRSMVGSITVRDSASRSAALCSSVNGADSRQAGSTSRVLSFTPALRALGRWMLRQVGHPLIWETRTLINSMVSSPSPASRASAREATAALASAL